MKSFFRAAIAAAALFCASAHADQPSIVLPDVSSTLRQAGLEPTWNNVVNLYLNPALRGIASNFAGPSCATGVQAPVPYQWCVDTAARTVNLYSGPAGSTNYSWHPAFSINGDGSIASNVTIPTPLTTRLGGIFQSTAPTGTVVTGVDLSGNLIYGAPPASGAAGAPGQFQVNASGVLSGITLSGGVTVNSGTGVVTLNGAGTPGQFQINSAGVMAGLTLSGGISVNTGTGLVTLGAPGASALGGIFSATAPINQFQTGVDTSGNPTFAQPSVTNLTEGSTGTGTVARSVSPTLTGTPLVTATQPTWSTLNGLYSGFRVNVGSLPNSSMDASAAGSIGLAHGIIGTVDIPATYPNNHFVNAGVAVYVRNSNTNTDGSGVGGFFVGMAGAASTVNWGVNTICSNTGTTVPATQTGLNGIICFSSETDVNWKKLPGGGTPTGQAIGAAIFGGAEVKPTGGATGLQIAQFSQSTPNTVFWDSALTIFEAPNTDAITIGAANSGGNGFGSQPIRLNNRTSGGVNQLGRIYTDATAVMILSPNVGSTLGQVAIQDGNGGTVLSTTGGVGGNVSNSLTAVSGRFTFNSGNYVGTSQCGKLSSADFHSTADQSITINPPTTPYMLTAVRIVNPSAALPSAVGGIYTATGKGGIQVVSSSQVYSAITTTAINTAGNSLTITPNNNTTTSYNLTALQFSLTTTESTAKTADIIVYCAPYN